MINIPLFAHVRWCRISSIKSKWLMIFCKWRMWFFTCTVLWETQLNHQKIPSKTIVNQKKNVNNKSLIPEKRWSMGAKSQVPQLVGINPFEKKLNWDVFPQTVVKMRLCWKPPPSKAVRSTARILQEIEFPVFQMSGSCFSFGGGRGQLRPPEICFKKAFG